MGFKERVSRIGRRLVKPATDFFWKEAVDAEIQLEANILKEVTRFNSPDFNNITVLQTPDGVLSPPLNTEVEVIFERSGARLDYMRVEATARALAVINDRNKRRKIHIQGLEAALGNWYEKSKDPQNPVEQSLYRINADRILDDINVLRRRASGI